MFFESQPNIYYPQSKGGAKLSKNLFRRVRFRDNINALYINSFKYTIREGETPETISYEKYGSTEWYWTILLLNNIIDVNNDWPIDSVELDASIEKEYGPSQNQVRHWETYQIKNTAGVIVLPGGVIIETNNNSIITQKQGNQYIQISQNSPNYYPTYSFTFKDGPVVRTLTGPQVLKRVTNREYEFDKNEKKKEIYLIQKKYLSKMKEEIAKLFAYDTQYNIDELGVRLPDV
jgi:hypothetical protein